MCSLQRQPRPDKVGPDSLGQTFLQGISIKAKYSKSHRFENLYRCLDGPLLQQSWKKLNKSASAGVDKVHARDYATALDDNLGGLVSKLKQQSYRSHLIKRKYIPKSNGKQRPLGIPVLEDRLLQTAAAQLLSAIFEADFLPCSFGYRPGVGSLDASKALAYGLQVGTYGYVVEADIKGFFDNLQHDWLLRMLEQRVNDRALLGLIDQWLKSGILDTDGRVLHPETGTPQGGVISPILANVYLHYALDLWFEKVVKRHCRGRAMLIRYADDFVCAFQYREDAERFYSVLPKRLHKFGLSVAPEKTQIHRFSRFHPGKRRRFSFLGFEFYWEADRNGVAWVRRRTARKKLHDAVLGFKEWVKAKRHERLAKLLKAVRQKLTGHYNYFGVIGNIGSLRSYHRAVLMLLHKWLNRRSQRRGMTWGKLSRLAAIYAIPSPYVTEPQGVSSRVLAGIPLLQA